MRARAALWAAIGAFAAGFSALSILRHVFPDRRERALAIGIWSAVAAVGAAVGPLVGGLLLEHFWWGSVFLINLPLMAAGLLVGRWLLTSPRILVLDEPTRGVDIGAKAEIHRLISTLAANGAAVIMISSEMPEILGMSDRVMVMRQGRVAGILERRDANQLELMRLAAH